MTEYLKTEGLVSGRKGSNEITGWWGVAFSDIGDTWCNNLDGVQQ